MKQRRRKITGVHSSIPIEQREKQIRDRLAEMIRQDIAERVLKWLDIPDAGLAEIGIDRADRASIIELLDIPDIRWDQDNLQCWAWKGLTYSSPGRAKFVANSGKAFIAARLIIQMDNPGVRLGPSLKGRHRCGKKHCPWCCNPSHLMPGTSRENSHDRIEDGTMPYGDKNVSRRYPERRSRGERHGDITDRVVQIIRATYAAYGELRGLVPYMARRFEISKSGIHDILKGRNRKDTPPDPSAALEITPEILREIGEQRRKQHPVTVPDKAVRLLVEARLSVRNKDIRAVYEVFVETFGVDAGTVSNLANRFGRRGQNFVDVEPNLERWKGSREELVAICKRELERLRLEGQE